MRRFAVVAAAIIGLAVAVPPTGHAQQVLGMTSGYLLGGAQYGGGGSLNLYAALQTPSYAGAGQFAFSPDPRMRKAVTRAVLADVARNDKGLAGALGNDPFQAFGAALSAHNIRDSQLDDALAFMMLSLWDAANASSAETMPGQTEGVKRQARSLLAAMGGRPRGTSVQEASDSLYLSALMVSILASKVMEDGDPTKIAQLQKMARQESMASFGVDFARMGLTDQGLVPR